MNRRSFIAKLVGCVVAASLSIKLCQPEAIPTKGGIMWFLEQWEKTTFSGDKLVVNPQLDAYRKRFLQ